MRVLVVEDEGKLADSLQGGLQRAGFAVEVCADGESGFQRARVGDFAVVVLDILLPVRDGLSVLRALRAGQNRVPILLLTACDAVDDRVAGLELGADDYLVKPFAMDELIARIRALLRRHAQLAESRQQHHDLVLDRGTHAVWRGGKPIDLTRREFALLEYLMREPGRTRTRTDLMRHIWGYQFDPGTNLVDVAIRRLRQKLGDDSPLPLILTIRGAGYALRGES
jgi:DNA-binding response OmpR family regulator